MLRFQQPGSASTVNSGECDDVRLDTASLQRYNDENLELGSFDAKNKEGHSYPVNRGPKLRTFLSGHWSTEAAEAAITRKPRRRLSFTGGRRQSKTLPCRQNSSRLSTELVQNETPTRSSSSSNVGYCLFMSMQGFGLSLVDSTPQELAFFGCSGIDSAVRRLHGTAVHDFRFSIRSFQIDNGVAGAQHQTILRQATNEERMAHHAAGGKLIGSEDEGFTLSGASEDVIRTVIQPLISWDDTGEKEGNVKSTFFRFQFGGEWQQDATLLEYVDVELAPIAIHVEADTTFVLLRFLLRVLRKRNIFLQSLQDRNVQLVRHAAAGLRDSLGYKQLRAFPEATAPPLASLRPLYIRALCIRPMLIILSARAQRRQKRRLTAEHDELILVRHFEFLGDKIADITSFPLKCRLFLQQCLFTTSEQLVANLASSYCQQCIRQLHKLVASIDVIGNPLRLITEVSSGLRFLTTQPFGEPSESEMKAWALIRSLYMLVRTRIERPETFLDGCYVGSVGALQVLSGAVFAVAVLPAQRARESGCWGFCKGVLEGLASFAAGVVVTGLVLVTSFAAGVSTALRQKPFIVKTRPPRVFPPHLAVDPYAIHAAQAMSLLQGSTKNSLLPGTLQRVITAFPLFGSRSTRSHTHQITSEETLRHIKDYLILTSDLVVCLRDGQAQWVCRREDIEQCTVKVPAFFLGAVRAQQELFLKHRERGGAPVIRNPKSSAWQKEDPSKPSNGPYCIQITIKNKLQLPKTIIQDFPSAYKAYVNYVTTERNVVQAFTRLVRRGDNLNLKEVSINFPAVLLSRQGRILSLDKEALVSNEVDQCELKQVEGANSAFEQMRRENQTRHATETVFAEALSLVSTGDNTPSSIRWLLGCCNRRGRGNVGSSAPHKGDRSVPRSILKGIWSILCRPAERSPPPTTVTMVISAPDTAAALRIFDIICSARRSSAGVKKHRDIGFAGTDSKDRP
ncbi:hypothetical protein Efla_001371 [Eimeria flavescens]